MLQHEYELIRIVLPRDIQLSIELPEAALLVRIDKVVLCRILLNFATNARDAIAHKGKVVVSLKQVNLASYNRDDLFSSICPVVGAGVELLFSDSGHGIEAQNLDRIFCPYFSTKVGDAKSGSGLGLSSISRYAKENGFDFGVRSVVGKGTQMILLMPVDQQASKSVRMEASKLQNPTNTVLLEIPLIFGIRAACRNLIFNLQMELKQNKSSSFHLIQNDDQS